MGKSARTFRARKDLEKAFAIVDKMKMKFHTAQAVSFDRDKKKHVDRIDGVYELDGARAARCLAISATAWRLGGPLQGGGVGPGAREGLEAGVQPVVLTRERAGLAGHGLLQVSTLSCPARGGTRSRTGPSSSRTTSTTSWSR
eukprot:COSAG01_NODE_2074_length_8491_cov_4.600024_7_plen_143_part_00